MRHRHRLGIAIAALMITATSAKSAELPTGCPPNYCQDAYDECTGFGQPVSACMSMWYWCQEHCYGWIPQT